MRQLLIKAMTAAVALSVAATSVTAVAAPVGTDLVAPAVLVERNIKGTPIKVDPLPPMVMPTAAGKAVSWPAAGKSVVSVAARQDMKVAVETFGQEVSAKAGVAGVLVKVSSPAVAKGAKAEPASVRLDYSQFAHAYGDDYGSRLAFQQYPACVLTTPERPECRTGTPIASRNDSKRKELSAEVVTSGGAVLAAAAGNSGSGGNYGATSLSPSGAWSAGDSSGDFTYSIPLTMPAAPGGPSPQLAMAYSAGSIDGRTSATNNQASWVGDGWELSTGGFIERTYASCAEDKGGNQGDLQTGDLCWKDEKYTISLGGMSGKLVKDRITGKLRPERDDGSRIEKVGGLPVTGYNGEHWKVTSLDGTQYFLGLNNVGTGRPSNSVLTEPIYGNHGGEPCNQATFAASACTQAYRWSVDKVVDPLGNVMVFYYEKEINYYKRGGLHGVNVGYDAWGRLARIEWGFRANALAAKPPAQVVFETAERCLPSGAITCAPEQLNKDTATNWPDVPFDRICGAVEDCKDRYSPAFFSRKRLTRVVTQSLNAAGSQHDDVDSWSLRQEFPPTGDGMPRSLWLSGVKRTGYVGEGSATVPEIVFAGIPKDNRVDGLEGLLPITRYRITRIVGEAGSLVEVKYMDPDCVAGQSMPAPEANTRRCYPVFWTPPGATEPRMDWFHKYVVSNVSEDARTGGPSITKSQFLYEGGGAWHYDSNDEQEAKYRTWSEWRGYGRVRTVKGDPSGPQTISETLYLRGMGGSVTADGVVIQDADELMGFSYETLLYSGGRVVSGGVNVPELIETANDGKDRSVMIRSKATIERALQEDNSWRRTKSSTTYDTAFGLSQKVETEGEAGVSGDESCTQTTYAQNTSLWMLTYISSVRTIAKLCSAWPGTDDDVTSDVKSAFDGAEEGVPPTKGIVTATSRRLGPGNYQKVGTSKADDYGRTIESTDVDGAKTTVSYTPSSGNPNTVTTVNRAGWETKSYMDTARGTALTEIGVNGERADLEYDQLGRLVKVWQPGRSKEARQTPTTEYTYEYRSDAPTIVTTKSITEQETYRTSYDLLDGMLRPRQSQTPSPIGGRILTDSFYDSRGNTYVSNAAYYNLDAPSTVLFGAFDNAVPSQTVFEFDDLGRPLETILRTMNTEVSRTKTRYAGDNSYTTPPVGDTPSAVIKNALGVVVERREYKERSADGRYGANAAYDATKYAFNDKGLLTTVTDVTGNKWESKYDKLGRKYWSSDPDSGVTTYEYNDLDQLVSTKDARGRKLVYGYDDLGRKTTLSEEDSAGVRTKLTEDVYDSLRRGMLTSSTRYVGGNAYTSRVDRYDALNRPDISSVVIPANEGKLAATYTFRASFSAVTGQLTSESLPAIGGLEAENVIHTYNEFGLPERTYGKNTYDSEYQYSPYGETLRVTLGVSPTKVWVNNTYSEGHRRLTNTQVKTGGEPGTVVSDKDYGYDPAGNITKLTQKAASAAETQCFGYDHLRRMTSAWTPSTGDCAAAKDVTRLSGPAPYWYDFGYDQIGNRKSQVQHTTTGDTTETYDVPAPGAVRPHGLTAVNRTGPTGTSKDEFTYDQSGNTKTRKIGGNTQTLDWNAEGRVSKVTEADGKTSEYLYDSGGSRLLKREPNATTLYLPGHEVILTRATDTLTAKRYYGSAVRGSVDGLQWLLADHNGTDDLSITADNLWTQRQHTDPFGNPRGTQSRWWPDDKGLAGGIKDFTGFTSMGAREYDPRTGRFASVDPVMDDADSQQINGYAYANNSPVTFNDASGLMNCGPDGVLCGKLPYMFDQPSANDSPAKQAEIIDRTNAQYQRERAAHRADQRFKREARNNAGKRAARELGMSDEERQRLEDEANSKKGFWDVIKAEIPDIIGDLTGFNDLRDCFTKGDLWACISIIPWGKVIKLVSSAKKVFKAVQKALKWEDRVMEARNTLRRLTGLTEKYTRDGMEGLDEFRKREVDDVMSKAGESCKKHSFPPGTRVLLSDGTPKPIEQVQRGDVVVATDSESGRAEARAVVATWIHDNEPTRTELTIDVDGSAGSASSTIEATDWHPFWVVNLNAWVPVADIRAGSWLRTSAGTEVQVTAVRSLVNSGLAYDLTVDVDHSYHVLAGSIAVSVHNCTDVLSNEDGADNVATLAAHEEDTAFSGVYDPDTEEFFAHRNVPERTPASPPDVVNQAGGHGIVNLARFGGSRSTVAFTAFKERDGLSVSWLSRSVNRRNHGDPYAPMEHRQGILDALSEATGLPVWSR